MEAANLARVTMYSISFQLLRCIMESDYQLGAPSGMPDNIKTHTVLTYIPTAQYGRYIILKVAITLHDALKGFGFKRDVPVEEPIAPEASMKDT